MSDKKPIKKIEGKDPALAKAMKMEAQKDMSAEEIEAQDKKQWLSDHIERVQAQGRAFF